jgi:hypothetical protein
MFKSVTSTWNVFKGCRFNCTYCSARSLALRRLSHSPRYADGFRPRLIEEELQRTFKPGEFIFVAYMGDIAFATTGEVDRILDRVERFPGTRFLFCSKNPRCYSDWGRRLPDNVVLGTTIETNKNHDFSLAPHPFLRYIWLRIIQHPHKFVSIEPVMDLDTDKLVLWLYRIQPEIIEVGADNYHNHLPEPQPEQLEGLLAALRSFCPTVIEKDGLERLKKHQPGEGEANSSANRSSSKVLSARSPRAERRSYGKE